MTCRNVFSAVPTRQPSFAAPASSRSYQRTSEAGSATAPNTLPKLRPSFPPPWGLSRAELPAMRLCLMRERHLAIWAMRMQDVAGI